MPRSRLPSNWRLDPEVVRRAYDQGAAHLVELARSGEPDRWGEPALGDWTRRDLLGHASRALSTVGAYLDAAAEAEAEGGQLDPLLVHPVDYYVGIMDRAGDTAALAERARAAGRALGDDPPGAVAELAATTLARVAATEDAAVLVTPAGPMQLIEYLPTRIYELTLHGFDLATAFGRSAPITGPTREDMGDALAVALLVAAGIVELRGDTETALRALSGRGSLPPGFGSL